MVASSAAVVMTQSRLRLNVEDGGPFAISSLTGCITSLSDLS